MAITFSLTDDAGGKFAIDSTTGVVTTASANITAGSYNVTVRATDGSGWVKDTVCPITVSVAIPAGSHRYWRLRINSVTSDSGVTILELEFRTTSGGADQTGSGTASASSTFSGAPASNAFDNSIATNWSSDFSNTWPQSISYDFGAGVYKNIGAVLFTPFGNLARAPTNLDLQYSDDGTTWTTKQNFTRTWPNAAAFEFVAP